MFLRTNGRSLRIPMKPLSTSRPLIWRRKSAAMYGVIQTAGAKRLPSQACSIVPIAAARCMSTAPTMARGFLNIPVSNYTKVPCGTLCPTQHRINESAVLTLVSDTLRAIADIREMTGRNLFTLFRRRRLLNRVPIYRKKRRASGCCPKESRRTGKTDLQNL